MITMMKRVVGHLVANPANKDNKTMLIVGSQALHQHIWLDRSFVDLDIIGTYDDIIDYVKSLPGELTKAYLFNDGKKHLFIKGGKIIEAEIAWEGSTAEEFLTLMYKHIRGDNNIATLNGLYTLKMSHRYLRNSPYFLKTMSDIKLMRSIGAEITDDLMPFFKRREKETYNYSHPKLNVLKKDFFNGDGVNYVYDHDSIHEAVKHQEHPAYYYFKPDTSEVAVSKEMFDSIPEQIKLNSVLEESYVLAIERSQVPFPGRLTYLQSFEIALQKVCTSITSGWWREYAWENYGSVIDLYDYSYIDRFWAGVNSGLVKEIKND